LNFGPRTALVPLVFWLLAATTTLPALDSHYLLGADAENAIRLATAKGGCCGVQVHHTTTDQEQLSARLQSEELL